MNLFTTISAESIPCSRCCGILDNKDIASHPQSCRFKWGTDCLYCERDGRACMPVPMSVREEAKRLVEARERVERAGPEKLEERIAKLADPTKTLRNMTHMARRLERGMQPPEATAATIAKIMEQVLRDANHLADLNEAIAILDEAKIAVAKLVDEYVADAFGPIDETGADEGEASGENAASVQSCILC